MSRDPEGKKSPVFRPRKQRGVTVREDTDRGVDHDSPFAVSSLFRYP